MTAGQIAEMLLIVSNCEVLLRVGNDWVEVCGVQATGQHRNAVTLVAQQPALDGGVIVVPPDSE